MRATSLSALASARMATRNWHTSVLSLGRRAVTSVATHGALPRGLDGTAALGRLELLSHRGGVPVHLGQALN